MATSREPTNKNKVAESYMTSPLTALPRPTRGYCWGSVWRRASWWGRECWSCSDEEAK